METTKVLVKIDCYPSKSPAVLRWLSDAFTEAGVNVVEASAGEKYLFGCWDAWVTIPSETHTKENEARVMEALRRMYQKNNPYDSAGPEPDLIRGMILYWEEESHAN